MRTKIATGAVALCCVAALIAGVSPAQAAAKPPEVKVAGTSVTRSSVTPNGGLPGGNQSLEVFNSLVRLVTPPTAQTSSKSRRHPRADIDWKAVSDVGGTIAGLGGLISGLAFGFTSDADLKKIITMLGQIQNTLNTMQTELTQIQSSINALTAMVTKDFQVADCITSLQGLNADTATITSAQKAYNQLVTQTNNAYANPDPVTGLPNTNVAPSKAQLLAFSSRADDLSFALSDIQTQLLSGSTPVLYLCAPVANGLVTQDLNAEDQYYSTLYELVEREYAMQVQGLQLLVTMNMIDAWVAAFPNSFNPTATQNVSIEQLAYVCFPDSGVITDPNVEAACDAAAANVAMVYDNVWSQMLYAGIPYLWGTNGQASTQVSTSTTSSGGLQITPNALWARDLNDFQATNSDGTPCPYPLANSTSNVCGGSVGTTGGFANDTWQSLSGWRPATTADWQTLLGTVGSTASSPLATTMELKGMTVPGDYVIYTGETSDITAGPALWTQAWLDTNKQTKKTYGYTNGLCLLDTNAQTSQSQWTSQPFCDQAGGGTLAYLMNTPVGTQKYGFSGLVFGGNMSLLSNWDLTSSNFDWWRYRFYFSGAVFTSTDSGHTGKSGGEYVQGNTFDQSQQTFSTPGWASGWNLGPNPSAGQQLATPTSTFRWPVRSLGSIDCSWRKSMLSSLGAPVPKQGGVNPIGMPSMCQSQGVLAWLAQVLPNPEPPLANQQVDDVASAPANIPSTGVTTVLKAGAVANLSARPLSVKVRVATTKAGLRPTGDVTHSKSINVIRKPNGKVQVQTFGRKHLRITLTYVAKKRPHFKRFEQSFTYRVK